MATRRLDTLFVELLFRGDTKGLENVNQKLRNMDRQIQAVTRGIQVAVTAAIAIGGAAFFTGSKTEREFVKLRTQLGDTAEQVEAVRPQLEALSEDTGRPLADLATAFFNLKSSVQGISDEEALEVIAASAKGATIELGRVDDLALVAGVAIRQFGSDTISGQKALDILHATVKSGTIPDAGALASNFGRLLGPGKELNLTFEELAAAVAGYSQSGQAIPTVVDAIRQALTQLNAPSTEAQKVLDRIFPEATNSAQTLREMIGRDGLFQTLQFLRKEIGDDAQALRRLVGDVNALGFVLDATGDLAHRYTDALEANRNALDSVNAGLEIYKTTGAFQAQIATNNLRLVLDSLYNTAVVPLLNAFGKLPSLLQTVVVALGTLSAASLVLGGPSLGKLIGAIFTTDWSVKLLSIQLRLLTVQTWLSNAAAKALASGKWLLNAATTALTLSFWRNLASMAALRIGMLAGAVATGVATAAQWALNAAMWANPIGLIILGIVALIAALGAVAYAIYRFRDTIVGAFKTAWNWIKDNWPLLLAIITGPIGLAVLGIIRFKDDIIGAFADVRDFIIGAWRAVVDFIVDKFNMVKDLPGQLLDAIPGGGLIRQAAGLLGFSEGGIVPGPPGRPLPAMLHGGEVVLPVEATSVLARMMNGFAAGPNAILPVAPARVASSTMNTTSRSVSIEISGPININVPEGADGREIAQTFREALRDELENLVRDSDSNIAR